MFFYFVQDEDAIRPPGPHEVASSLSTLRYQLFKMQQELLRRQVGGYRYHDIDLKP